MTEQQTQPERKPVFQFIFWGKNEPKKVVQMTMTKSQVEGYGFNRHMKRTAGKFSILLAVLIVIAVVGAFAGWHPNITVAILFGVLMLWVYWATICAAAGKRLWREIKDKDEPVTIA